MIFADVISQHLVGYRHVIVGRGAEVACSETPSGDYGKVCVVVNRLFASWIYRWKTRQRESIGSFRSCTSFENPILDIISLYQAA